MTFRGFNLLENVGASPEAKKQQLKLFKAKKNE